MPLPFGDAALRDSQALVQIPELAIWIAVNAVPFALYPIIGLLIFRSLVQYRGTLPRTAEIAAPSILLFCLFMLVQFVGGVISMQALPVQYAAEKLLVVELLASLPSRCRSPSASGCSRR